ncbi:MAG: DUF2752 domain-containing protein [Planctomycetes bacterium]|nr:DUF2752 domain-containing protein [Planctomycetota bacterium]
MNRKWIFPLIVFVAGVSAAVVLYAVDPAGCSFCPPCPFRFVTRLNCPGCGSLRASHLLLHGNVGAAFKLNPLMVLSLPYLMYSLASYVSTKVRGRPLPGIGPRPTLIRGVLVVILAYWVVRNTSLYAALIERL